jgi:hypothetical protein
MRTYHFRVLPSGVDTLINSLIFMGVLKKEPVLNQNGEPTGSFEVTTVNPEDIWDSIGPVMKPTGGTIVVEGESIPEMEAVNSTGTAYRHYNLLTDMDIKQVFVAKEAAIAELTLEGETELTDAFVAFSANLTPFTVPPAEAVPNADKIEILADSPVRVFA